MLWRKTVPAKPEVVDGYENAINQAMTPQREAFFNSFWVARNAYNFPKAHQQVRKHGAAFIQQLEVAVFHVTVTDNTNVEQLEIIREGLDTERELRRQRLLDITGDPIYEKEHQIPILSEWAIKETFDYAELQRYLKTFRCLQLADIDVLAHMRETPDVVARRSYLTAVS